MYLNANPSSTFTKFTGFVTGIKFFSRFVTEKEWLTHAKSYTNYGVSNPKINYNFEKLESGSFERLVLHTDTKQKTKESDSLGNIRLFDFSKNNLHFEGKNFPESSLVLKPTRVNYEVLSDKFDINYSKNKVRIRSFQDEKNKENGYYSEFAPVHEIITSEESIDDNRLSLDMSVMKGVNRNILNAFSSLDILETGIGSPNLLFSENYPVLEDIRNLYFENFTEKINLSKYRDLFKWIDNSFTEVVYSIVPRTTNFLGINFIYESHVLERHKYKYLHDNIYKKSLERVYPEGEYPEVLDLELPEVNVEVIASETNGNASSLASGERLENSSVKSIPSKTMITIII